MGFTVFHFEKCCLRYSDSVAEVVLVFFSWHSHSWLFANNFWKLLMINELHRLAIEGHRVLWLLTGPGTPNQSMLTSLINGLINIDKLFISLFIEHHLTVMNIIVD